MAIRSTTQLKAWFRRGKYPTEEQFADWIDSFVHKEEDKVPMEQVDGLPEQLNGKFPDSAGQELERQQTELANDFNEYKTSAEHFFEETKDDIEALEYKNEQQQEEIDRLKSLVPGFNTLYMDITDVMSEDDIYDIVSESLKNQLDGIDDFNKPFQVVIVDDKYTYLCDDVCIKEATAMRTISFRKPNGIDWLGGDTFIIKYKKSTNEVDDVYLSSKSSGDAMFLKENGDGMLNATDGGNWNTLKNKLAAGEKPTLYINPRGKSELYYPASYNSVNNDDGIVLNIEISYPVTTDDKTELWVEKWDFAKFDGLSSQYEHKIEKLPLSSDTRVLVVDLDLIPEDGNLNSEPVKESVLEQIKGYGINDKLRLYFKLSNVLYECNKLSFNTGSSDASIITVANAVVNESPICKKIGGNTVTIVFGSNAGVDIYNASVSSSNYDEVVFLTENADGVITAFDKNWQSFADSLNAGLKPAVYLKSLNSNDIYCPASYDFVLDSNTGNRPGFIEIAYPKTVDGKDELWIERWTFPSAPGTHSTYEYKIKKIPLGGSGGSVPEFVFYLPDEYDDGEANDNYDSDSALAVKLKEYYNLYKDGNAPSSVFVGDSAGIYSASVEANTQYMGFGMYETYIHINLFKRDEDGNIYEINNIEASFVDGEYNGAKIFHRYYNRPDVNVVSEYPTDLSDYPDGSIFIKTE